MSRLPQALTLGQQLSLARAPHPGDREIPILARHRRVIYDRGPVWFAGHPIGHVEYVEGCLNLPVLKLDQPAGKLGLC